MKLPKICRYCGGKVEVVPAGMIYGAATLRPGLDGEKIYLCLNCNARVGCHRGTHRPLGNLANEVLRLKRMEARQEFEDIASGDRAAMSECLGKLNAEFCSCPERSCSNAAASFLYVQAHMEVERWRLQYKELTGVEDRRLCRIGTCRVCGKALCEGILLDAVSTVEELFSEAWERLQLVGCITNHAALLAHTLRAEKLYVSMFHKEDQPAALAWFERHVSEVTK